MDQDVINLAKAIRQKESGNRAVIPAEGSKLGGASRYQYTHNTWKETARKYLGDPNAPLSLQNENKATYLKIKDWKDKGYNPAQIASMWNAGEGRPNAYQENHKGVNKYGVAYDTPKYVESVYNEYQKIKGGSQRQPAQPIQPTVAEQRQTLQAQGQPVARNPERVEPTFGGKIARDVLKTPARLLENIKAVPKLLQGQSYEDATSSESKYFGGTIQGVGTKGGRTNLKNFGSQLKDTAGAGLEMASYLPVAGAVGGTANLLKQSVKLSAKQLATQTAKRLGLNAVEGAVGNTLFEGGKKLQEEPDRESLGKSALYGAGGGLAFGLGGRALSGVIRGARKTAVAFGKGAIPEDLATEATQRLGGAWSEYINDFKDLTSFRDKYKQKTGANIEDILTREVITPEIKGNKIDLTESMAKNEAKITSSAENVKGLAKAFNDVPVRLSDLEQSAIGVVNDTNSILSSGNILKARKGVEDLFKGLREAYGENINPEIANDIRLAMNRQTKAFTGSVGEMFEQDIANAVGDAVRTKLDEVIQDDVFRRANAEVGELLNVRKFMNKVNGKNIGGGRFSQAFAGIVGSQIMGGANRLPVVGELVGYMGGKALQKQANQFAFGKAGPRTRAILRRMENKSAIGAEVAEKTNNRKQVLLPARTSPVNKAFGSGKTINLPPKAQSTIDAQEMANLSLKKIKKGDYIEVKGEEVEVTLKTDDGIVVKDGSGKREFIPLQDTRGLKRINQEFNDAEGEVATEMLDLSKAGKRIMRQDGSFVAEPSTFPKWISEDLRSMSLFKSVMEKIKNNKPIRGSREQRLYNEIKEEVTNRTIKKSDEIAKAGEVSLAQKANEMSFEDFEKFYNTNKGSIKENVPNLKKFWSENNYGGEQAFGAVAGLEKDEDGNLKFNKDKALLGVAGMAVAKKAGLMKGVNTKIQNKYFDKAKEWVYDWMEADSGMNRKITNLPKEVESYLGQFKPKEPIKLYRGIRADQTLANDVGIESWTHKKYIAEGFADGGKVIEKIVDPKDIVFDIKSMPASIRRDFISGSDGGMAEAEVLVRSNKSSLPKADNLTTSIQKAKASGQSFDEWVKGQSTELNYKNLQENDYSIKAYGKDFNEPVEYFRAGQVRKNGDIWLTDNEAGAMQYSGAGGGTKVGKYIVQSKNPLIIDTAGGKYAKGNIDINKILTKEEIAKGYTNNPDTKKKFIDYAKNNGYDAVQFSDSFPDGEGGMRSLVVWNKDALKTRSQLKAEWDKVSTNKSGVKLEGVNPEDIVSVRKFGSSVEGKKNPNDVDHFVIVKDGSMKFSKRGGLPNPIIKTVGKNQYFIMPESDGEDLLQAMLYTGRKDSDRGYTGKTVDVTKDFKNQAGFAKSKVLNTIAGATLGATAIANIPKNKTTYTAPKENPLLKTNKQIPDKKIGEALLQLESSGGTNKAKADEGEMKWLVGLTETAITELKRLKRIKENFNKNNREDVIKAGIEYFKLMQERNPEMTPAEVYVDKYWTQWKKLPNPQTARANKIAEFQKLISVEN